MNPSPTQRTRIKICGITDGNDAIAAAAAGADAIGFVFYEMSPRNIHPMQAARIAAELPPFVTTVALFVDEATHRVRQVLQTLRPGMLQFHGDETPEWCSQFSLPWMKAVRMRPGVDLLDLTQRYSRARALLLDAYVDGYGGSGKVFDWSLIPPNVGCPLVLSGGLTPANVADGITAVRPWAVDVSSGVEYSKGVKDPEKIRQFCKAVRTADAHIYS
jgi:phosphoribosylanthranilate isomerase